jgi:hypothetical protein
MSTAEFPTASQRSRCRSTGAARSLWLWNSTGSTLEQQQSHDICTVDTSSPLSASQDRCSCRRACSACVPSCCCWQAQLSGVRPSFWSGTSTLAPRFTSASTICLSPERNPRFTDRINEQNKDAVRAAAIEKVEALAIDRSIDARTSASKKRSSGAAKKSKKYFYIKSVLASMPIPHLSRARTQKSTPSPGSRRRTSDNCCQ